MGFFGNKYQNAFNFKNRYRLTNSIWNIKIVGKIPPDIQAYISPQQNKFKYFAHGDVKGPSENKRNPPELKYVWAILNIRWILLGPWLTLQLWKPCSVNRVVEAKNLFMLTQFPSEYIQTISMKSNKVHC